MQSNNSVEWELVDYGPGVFHVVSYQAGLPAADAVAAEPVAETVSNVQEIHTPDCFFYRCWAALRDGCQAA
ncbi:MAG: hypothetical protein R2748_27595 [Bryobacterales bacterium]